MLLRGGRVEFGGSWIEAFKHPALEMCWSRPTANGSPLYVSEQPEWITPAPAEAGGSTFLSSSTRNVWPGRWTM